MCGACQDTDRETSGTFGGGLTGRGEEEVAEHCFIHEANLNGGLVGEHGACVCARACMCMCVHVCVCVLGGQERTNHRHGLHRSPM